MQTTDNRNRHPGDPADDVLMTAVRDGDIDRLGVLFDRYGNRLYGYFVRVTGNEDLSWDFVQDVFFRILKYRQSYRPGGRFYSWMFQIAHNVVRSHFGKRDREVPLEPFHEDRAASADVLPLRRLETEEQHEMLNDAFTKLSDDKREILSMSHFERVPYADIALALDCSVGAVKVRVHRAVKALKDIYIELQKNETTRRPNRRDTTGGAPD